MKIFSGFGWAKFVIATFFIDFVCFTRKELLCFCTAAGISTVRLFCFYNLLTAVDCLFKKARIVGWNWLSFQQAIRLLTLFSVIVQHFKHDWPFLALHLDSQPISAFVKSFWTVNRNPVSTFYNGWALTQLSFYFSPPISINTAHIKADSSKFSIFWTAFSIFCCILCAPDPTSCVTSSIFIATLLLLPDHASEHVKTISSNMFISGF